MEPRPLRPQPLRILHLASPGTAGGLESVVQGLTAGLRQRGHGVWLACTVLPGAGEPPIAVRARDAGVNAVTLRMGGRAYLAEHRALSDLMRREGIQVVHTHGYRSDVVGGSAARRLGTPQVTTAHGFIGGTRRGRFYEWLQLRSARRAAAAVAVSRPIVEVYRAAGVPEDRIHLIPNAWAGADPLGREAARAALGLRPGAPLLGWVGRLSREKGPDVFVEALGLLRELSWEAVVIGEGPERTGLEARAGELGLRERLRWLGVVPDAGRLMAAFDGFVLSSRTEGTPVALLEAMAAGVATVASRVGGVPDVISEREAWLVAPEAPQRLAEGLRALLADGREAAARRDAGRERLLQERASGPWISRHESLYQSLLSREDPARPRPRLDPVSEESRPGSGR